MNFMGMFRTKQAETRQANYTEALTQALQGILDQKPVRADALAVVESCVSLIADPLLVATTIGLPLPPRMLYTAARDLLRHGNSVWVPSTHPPEHSNLTVLTSGTSGDTLPTPRRGNTTSETGCPFRQRSKAPTRRREYVHLRLASPPGSDWNGQAPWETASISAGQLWQR